MQKSTMLFVVGILLVIGGGFSILTGLLALVGGGLVASVGGTGAAVGGGLIMLASLVLLAGGAFNLVSGILGIKNHKSPEKAGICLKLGIAMLIIQAVGLVLNIAGGGAGIVSSLVGFVLPVLYYIGAKQLSDMQGGQY